MRWVILLCLLAGPALANEPPRSVNFQTVLTDLDGKPMNWDCKTLSEDKKDCLEWRETTLSVVSMMALTKQWPNEDMKIEDQIRRTLLAQEIYKKMDVVLDSKDTDLLCTAIAKLVTKANMSTLITFRAIELLDPVRLKNAK